jgi:DNA-binding protein H-NS
MLAEIFLHPIPSKYLFLREALMPAPNLKNMDVDALLALRAQIDGQLATRRSDLQKQLARLQRASTEGPVTVGGRTSAMKGVKVKPKYRDARTGDTWAGRGVQPRWLTAALKSGKNLEDYLIDKIARKPSGKTRRKRK